MPCWQDLEYTVCIPCKGVRLPAKRSDTWLHLKVRSQIWRVWSPSLPSLSYPLWPGVGVYVMCPVYGSHRSIKIFFVFHKTVCKKHFTKQLHKIPTSHINTPTNLCNIGWLEIIWKSIIFCCYWFFSYFSLTLYFNYIYLYNWVSAIYMSLLIDWF